MMQITSRSRYYPDYTADSILDIDYELLMSQGITSIVFDLDDTLVRRGRNDISPEYVTYLQALTHSGLHILIGTNSKRDLRPLFQTLGIDIAAVQPTGLSYKPFSSFYQRIMVAAETKPEHITMVGDQIINDVIGAKRAGLKTILVPPFHRKPIIFYRFYQRRISRRIPTDTAR